MTPDGWRRTVLDAAIGGITTGVSVNSESRPRTAGEVGVLKTSAVTYGRFNPHENKTVLTAELLRARENPRAGNVLLSRMNTPLLVGASAYVDRDWPDLVLPDRIWQIRPRQEILDGQWLSFHLAAPSTRAALTEIASGTSGSMKNISQEKFLNLPVLLPPLGEQRKIAAILSSVDGAIEASQAVIDQLQVVKKAMMAELLTRGLPGRHTRFKQTEIGEVPESWDVARLGDVCEKMFVGIAQAATHAYVDAGGVPIIRTTNVKPNHLRTSDILRINDQFANEMSSKRLRAGDVLSARTGNPGVSVVVPPEFEGAQCFTLLVSRPGPGLVPQFLCHLMNSLVGERIVRQGQAGGAQQNLNVGTFEEALVGLPSVDEQKAICAVLDALHFREREEEGVIAALTRLRQALMSVLLTGEVRVKPDPEAA